MAVVRYYGAKRDSYDGRDLTKVYDRSEVPQVEVFASYRNHSKNLSKYVVQVYDQGQLGSCTANALCAAYGLDLKKQESTVQGGFTYFSSSRLFLYYNTRDYENTTQEDAGASIRDTVKALNRKGVCKEEDWPYRIYYYNTKPPQRAYANAQGNNLCKYERLSQDVDQLRACLNDDCPFIFGFNIYKSFHESPNNITKMPSRLEKRNGPLGRHAVVAVGYSDEHQVFLVLNSWGKDWGQKGYFYMPYDFIKDSELCFDFWKITFACQRGKPRPKGTQTWQDTWSAGGGGGGGLGACGYSTGGASSYRVRRY